MMLDVIAERGGVEDDARSVEARIPIQLVGRQFPSGGASSFAVSSDKPSREPPSRELQRTLYCGSDMDRRMSEEQRGERDVEGRRAESPCGPVDDSRAGFADDDVERVEVAVTDDGLIVTDRSPRQHPIDAIRDVAILERGGCRRDVGDELVNVDGPIGM